MKHICTSLVLFLIVTQTTAITPYPPPYNTGIFSFPPPSNDQICPSIVNQILDVSSLYQLDNACDLLLATSSTLTTYIQGFRANCSIYDDVESIKVCNRLNNDEIALKKIIDATLSAVEGAAQQCAGCSIPSSETAFAISGAAKILPGGKNKKLLTGIRSSRNLLQPQSSCERVGQCFSACNDCQRYEALCGTVSTVLKGVACSIIGNFVNGAIRFAANGLCVAAGASLCPPPTEPLCVSTCLTVVGGVASSLATGGCILPNIIICNNINSECQNCRTQTGECNPSTSSCCAGETGTECGFDCCCCPECYAPGGQYCECLPASC